MTVPSKRDFAMVAMREDGQTARQVAKAFGVSHPALRRAEWRVLRYRRALAVLQDDPLDIEALGITGKLPLQTAAALRERGFFDPQAGRFSGHRRLDELAQRTLRDLEQVPTLGEVGIRAILVVMQEHGLRLRNGDR